MVEASPEQASAPKSRSSMRRYLWIGIPLVLAVAAFLIWGLRHIEVTIAINGLHAHDPVQRRAHAEVLENYEDKEYVIGRLSDAVQDDDRSFAVRMSCARLLLDHFDRIGKLDQLLRTGSLSTRCVVLATVAHKPYFRKTYVDDPKYRVRETITEWLALDGDVTRFHAIQLAVKLDMDELVPEIRPLLKRSGAANIHTREERDVIIAAAGAMRHFKICDSVPEMLDIATRDGDPLVRLRLMQMVDEMSFRTDREIACPGAVSEDAMRTLVTKALEDEDHTVRMGAELILARMPDWAQAVLPRLREVLRGDFTGAERRHALEVLVAAGEPEDLERLPLLFHDADPSVRATAAAVVPDRPDLKLEGCLIGLVGAEAENEHLFIGSLQSLRKAAKQSVGLPQAWRMKQATDPAGFKGDQRTLFSTGQMGEVTRDGLAIAWFEWWCGQLGLDADETAEALAVRKAFWQAMDRRDVRAAEQALSGMKRDVPGLFTYERAWIDARSE